MLNNWVNPKTAAIPAHPELDEIQAVKEQSQYIGSFLEWLYEQRYRICMLSDDSDDEFDFFDDLYMPIPENIEELLAKYFEIDLKKVEQEKREILDNWRQNLGPNKNGRETTRKEGQKSGE